MNPKGYIAISFKSLPKDFRDAIESGSIELLEKHLARSVFSYATKTAAKHYFEIKNRNALAVLDDKHLRSQK
ncbi:MAG: hypothetical protein U9N57_01355 [Pseudomonadota bacterium]|nr:hypothetical protein [Pseudomonadota bacterium]